MANDLVVVDLSHWNEATDFPAAKKSGLIGIIHKATQGTTYVDDKYKNREQWARDSGLEWSTYHFLQHGNVDAQMDFYLKTINAPQGARVCLDYETESGKPSPTLDDLKGAIRRIKAVRPDLQIAVYSGPLIKEHLGAKHDAELAETSLWLAQYTSGTPTWPTGTWPTWTLWQYSDGSAGGQPRTVPGITSPIDCNAFNGTRENCAKWFRAEATPEPAPTPVPQDKEVKIEITAPEGVTVVISVNGDYYIGS